MGILSPFMFAARAFNTAANVYLAGQVGYWVYKECRAMQKEKLKASELRAQFVSEYAQQYGREPDEETIRVALRSYNAVEKPFQTRLKKIVGMDEK